MFGVNGQHISVTDARIQLEAHGALSKCEPLNSSIQDAMRIKGGVLVEYEQFSADRDVIAVSEISFSPRLYAAY